MLSLYCVQGKERGRRYPLQPGSEVVIGRAAGDDGITITDILASRRHLLLSISDDEIAVEDLGSANGSQLNGRNISKPVSAGAGDILTLGDTSLLVEGERTASGETETETPLQRRKRRSSQLLRTADLSPATPQPELHTHAGDQLLAFVLSSLPAAVLVQDVAGNVILANDRLKELAGLEIVAGRSAKDVLGLLAGRLRRPRDIDALSNGRHGESMRLETVDTWSWNAWVSEDERLRAFYILPEQDLA